jgi:RNA-directed DNA polymerase
VVSKETFAAVDAAVFKLVWRWAKRRHPHKGPAGCGRPTSAPRGTASGSSGRLSGRAAGLTPSTSSRRSVCPSSATRVQHGANPYDPAWEDYFEARLNATMKATYAGDSGNATCGGATGPLPHLRPDDHNTDGWEAHHIVWRSKGAARARRTRYCFIPTATSSCIAKSYPW